MVLALRIAIVALTGLLPIATASANDSAGPESQDTQRPHLQAALEIARWIQSSAIDDDAGRTWPPDPLNPERQYDYLYSGATGIVLFFTELAAATGDARWLEEAKAGARRLIHQLPATPNPRQIGLYTGISGVGWALGELYDETQEEEHLVAARRVATLVIEAAKEKDGGVEWDGVTDIIGGAAGTGLYLLDAAERLDHADARETAVRAGRRLVDVGIEEKGGTKWYMSASYQRFMPNFSHGTAGVCYFLLELYDETREETFLEAARSGLRYLDAVATKDDDGWLVFHHEPEGEDLFYLGWCHGPAGTARTYHRLWQLTGSDEARDIVRRSAHAVRTSGIPEEATPGFWNNVSICCGTAGVAELFLDLHRSFGDDDSLAFVHRLQENLMSRATRDGDGLRWIQAEHRVRPELLVAQTGHMQGAAGIGLWLLKLDAFEQGRTPSIRFPDSPF